MILSCGIFTISSVLMFLRSRNPMPTFLLIYHVRVTLKIQVNFRYRRYLKVLMILSYGFSQFLQYLCFRGQGIHCRHSYELLCLSDLENQGQLPVQGVLMILSCDFPNFFSIHVFEVKESIADIPTELLCSSDLENLGQLPVQEVLMVLTYKILKFLHCLCFQG